MAGNVWGTSYMGYDSTGSNILNFWTSYTGNPVIDQSGGRGGRGAAELSGDSLLKTLQPSDTWMVGTAIKVSQLSIANPILRFADSGSVQVELVIQTDGTLKATRGTGGPSLGISTFALHSETVYHIETQVVINNTTGSVKVWINGTLRLNITNVDTQFTTNATANSVTFNGVAGTTTTLYDTVVRWGADAASNLDDYFVKGRFAAADGFYSDWTPFIAGPHYLNVNKTEPTYADYISSLTPTNRDSFTFDPLSEAGATIYAVILHVAAEKDDGGVREIELFYRSGGVDYDSGTTEAVSVGSISYEYAWKDNPATATAWTPTEVDNFEGGVEHIT
jgi:hypothetical protein